MPNYNDKTDPDYNNKTTPKFYYYGDKKYYRIYNQYQALILMSNDYVYKRKWYAAHYKNED